MRARRTRSTTQAPQGAAQPAIDGAEMDLRDVEREVALTWLFEHHATKLTRLAVLLGASDDAEDAVSEAFCDLHRRWRSLRDPDAAPAWLRAAVCNQVRMRIRHLQVVRRYDEVKRPTQRDSDLESEVVQHENHREVLTALTSLPERQREALVLRYWADLREAEVAHAMGISPGSVKVHTSRGMAALESALGSIRSDR